MSQSTNSSAVNNSIKVEYHYGPRNSKQILFKNNLFGYFRNDQWRCINKKCGALISVDISTDEITDTFKAVHLGHGDRSCCEIEVRRSIEQMKLEVAKEPTIDPKDIYDRNITAVIKKGFILSDIHNYILPYQKFRGTLYKIKEKERPALPKSLKDIDFKLPQFKQWTETIEGTPFLRYDNLNNARRIIIFMSEYGIEWLRDATRIHSDGTFEICPELFFNYLKVKIQESCHVATFYCLVKMKKFIQNYLPRSRK